MEVKTVVGLLVCIILMHTGTGSVYL